MEKIGKYRILRKLGQGGFGDVYLAEDASLGKKVALKVLAPAYMRQERLVRRFEQEAQTAARLDHAHIVQILDLGMDQGRLYLAMAYLPGRTLQEVIAEEGPLPLGRTADLIRQIASALDYAHDQGVVHCDVKPANVLVDDRDLATLTDFGLARAAEGTEHSIAYYASESEAFSSEGTMIGTPEFMAPEQAEPSVGAIDRRTDIYALGVVVFQMLTGHLPFKATTPIATLRGHVDLPVPDPGQWVSLSRDAVAALGKALAKKPADRWSRAGDLARMLSAAAQQEHRAEAEEQALVTLYAEIEPALQRRAWVRALALCGQVMERHPGYREVDELFSQATQELSRQKQWEEQQEQLASLYAAAEGHMRAQDWTEAVNALERITAISGDYVYRDVPRVLSQAMEAKRQAEAERQAQVHQLRRSIQEHLQNVRNDLMPLVAMSPEDEQAAQELRLIERMLDRRSARAGRRPALPGSTRLVQQTRRPFWLSVLWAVGGMTVGLLLAWFVWPPMWTDCYPYDLAPEAAAEYVTLVSDSYRLDRDYASAAKRLEAWTPEEMEAAFADAIMMAEAGGRMDRVGWLRDLALVLGIRTGPIPVPAQAASSSERLVVPLLLFVLVFCAVVAGWYELRALMRWRAGRQTDR